MPENSPQGAPGPEQLTDLAADFRRERAATGDQRKEIALLVKQAAAEAERAMQRDRECASQLRQMEANIEAFPRPEIKRRYTESLESQMRLITWRSQQEQLRNRQLNLERSEELLDRVLEMADSLLNLLAERAALDQAGSAESSPEEVESSAGRAARLDSVDLAHHRLSRQLQDVAGQSLSDLVLRAEVCERLVAVDPQRAREEISGLRAAAAAALRSARRFAYGLEPPALEELGVAEALERYVEASGLGEKLSIELRIAGQPRRLPLKVETALFRIMQEALTNAARHSGTDQIEVKLRFETGHVVATVMDRGQGFEMEPVLARARRRGHSGLADMQVRAEMVGADLEISSKPGSGCLVNLTVSV